MTVDRRSLLRQTLASALPLLCPLAAMPQTPASPDPADPTTDDPYLWLEDVQGERALAWVRERNAQSRAPLEATPLFDTLKREVREVLDARDRIPSVVRLGGHLYNFWRDAQHPRGLWRRTTLAGFRRAEPAWELLLDLDALARRENENWVWSGVQCLGPAYDRCLVQLSRGGADATVVREFSIGQRGFVAGGFEVAEAKTSITWIDADEVYIGSDFGPGSLTDSGYPRVIRRWRRGQPLAAAPVVFEGEAADVAVSVAVDRTPGHERTVFGRALDFYRSREWLLGADGRLAEIDKPQDADLSFWRERALLRLKSDWTVDGRTHPAGTLLAGPAHALLAGRPRLTPLFTPTPGRSLAGYAVTRGHVLLNVLEHVAGRIEELRPVRGGWARRAVSAPFPGTLSVAALHDPLHAKASGRDLLAEHYLISYTDFLTPDSLMLGRTGSDARETLKTRAAYFDARGMRVQQHFATSKDGTRVPYFVIWPAAASQASGEGEPRPTLLYGYGGFEVNLQPYYSAAWGRAWMSRGGVRVIANIRGGGEYGPAWHQAAVKANKQKSYDDFAAVAEDLIARRITTPAQLGIQGGSNGGLLVGAVMLQRPELFGAVVCEVPLLDMRRYHKLLAGASWMAEYGNPDLPEEWAWISRYSPYQKALDLPPGVKLPRMLFTTSTRDDRVHPGHARKMVARLIERGHAPLYYENIEGGHGGAADNAQLADLLALAFSFLWRTLGPAAPGRAT